MTQTPPVPANIDEYIAAAAPAARPLLKEIRRVIREAAPEAEELISYRMPAFRQHGILIYFAAFIQAARRCLPAGVGRREAREGP